MICCNTHYLMPKMQTVKKENMKKYFWKTIDKINIVDKCNTIFKKMHKLVLLKFYLNDLSCKHFKLLQKFSLHTKNAAHKVSTRKPYK